jgi:phenylacetate-CoA ligase
MKKRRMIHADLRNPYYLEWIRFLKKSEKWDKKRIEEYQLEKIKEITVYAYENIPGYRELYDKAGVNPYKIRSFEDFREFPVVTKEMIRDNLDKFSKKIRGSKYVTTGGSTGIPFGFYRDKIAFARELASKAYQYYRIGWKEGDRQLVLRGLVIPSPNHIKYYPRFNELRCSSYFLTPDWMWLYYKKALEFKPKWLKCYPSSGYIFAKFLKENNLKIPSIKGVLCASENLYDFQKQLLKEVFNCRVFSHYGHYEMAVLAGFCEFTDYYHVLPQYGFAELLDKNGKPVTKAGEMGEIVATSFIMKATPFIRYRTLDLAVLKGWRCSLCKRPYQLWTKIEGRMQEFIITKNNRYISMTAINMHDDIFDHIKQFQFFQDKKGEVVFRFIPKPSCTPEIVEDMKKRLLIKLGSDVDLFMQKVKNIPLTPRGKYRFLIQKLKLPYGE